MTTRTLELRLHGFGAPAAPARAEIADLAPADRFKRAAVVFGAFVAVAIVALPIPIVHFMLVPGGLLLAVVLGGLRLREDAIFRDVSGAARSAGPSSISRCSAGSGCPRMCTARTAGGS